MNNLLEAFPVGIPSLLPYGDLLGHCKDMGEAGRLFKRNLNEDEYLKHRCLHIVIVGCGGTGGYVVAEVLRIVGGCPEDIQKKIYVTVIDGDEFEEKNLQRQLCTPEDIGENKAVALVSNYASYFGCLEDHVIAIPKYLTSAEQLYSYIRGIPGWKRMYERRPDMDDIRNNVFHPNRSALDDISLFDSNVYRDKQEVISHELEAAGYEREPDVTCIVIDCVDKNKPRKIIHDALETNWCKLSIEEYITKNMPSRLFTSSNINLDNVIAYSSLEYSKHPAIRFRIKNGDDNTYEELKYFSRLLSPVWLDDLHSPQQIYLISSGNGEFTGQVGWGRYCPLLSTTTPLRYKDIFGDTTVSSILGTTPITTEYGNTLFTANDLFKEGVVAKNVLQMMASGALKPDTSLNKKAFRMRRVDGSVYNNDPTMASFESFASCFVSVPSPYNRYPDLLDVERDEEEDRMSCADRAAHNIQNIYTNKTAQMLVINYFKAIFNGLFNIDDKAPCMLSTASVQFDIRTNTFMPEQLTVSYLNKYSSCK